MVKVRNFVLTAAAFASRSFAEKPVATGKYIVTLKHGVSASSFQSHVQWVNSIGRLRRRADTELGFDGIDHKYESTYGFNGYAGSFSEATLAEIKAHPEVQAVEPDQVWHLSWRRDEARRRRRSGQTNKSADPLNKQPKAPWGLATLSNRHPGATEYNYHDRVGLDTFAYVVDTGIRHTHNEFEGRAIKGYSAYDTDIDYVGHGTHVAGTIAGKTAGVVKKANVIAVKVLNDTSALTSVIMRGYNWAANDIIKKGRVQKAVVNMSLAGRISEAFNLAVERASEAGVVTVAAAGNFAVDANATSPASAKSAITVAAIENTWERATYSNFGPSVDIFAPGSHILSASNQDDSSLVLEDGTSMAAPHVTGLVLYGMSMHGISGPEKVAENLRLTATKDKVQGGTLNSPNLIGNNNVPNQVQ